MEIQTIIDAVNKIPTLEEKIEELTKLNRQLLKSQKEVLNLQDVHRFFHNKYSNRRVREIMRQVGASERGREIFVNRSDFERWCMANKVPGDLEARTYAATYVMNNPMKRTSARTLSENTPRSPLKRGEVG